MLLERPILALLPADALTGAGIYAIYYVGNFEAYRPVSELNRNGDIQAPIYVGKPFRREPEKVVSGWTGLQIRHCSIVFPNMRRALAWPRTLISRIFVAAISSLMIFGFHSASLC